MVFNPEHIAAKQNYQEPGLFEDVFYFFCRNSYLGSTY